MNELQKKIFHLIDNKIVFSESFFEQFFQISDIIYGKNEEFHQFMTDFIRNKGNCQAKYLFDKTHKYASAIRRLAKYQLDVYINEQKNDVIRTYFEKLKTSLARETTDRELSSLEYTCLNNVGFTPYSEINPQAVRAIFSIILLFSEYITNLEEVEELADAFDLISMKL